MEDGDGVLSFDFEGGLEAGSISLPVIPTESSAPSAPTSSTSNPVVSVCPTGDVVPAGPTHTGRRSFRQTVCRHWLRSLCMKGDACGFLHQYDKSRMPVCRFFRLYGECREQDCVYKHTNDDIKECNMFKLGFCPNGPYCRYRHIKLPGPPPPVEEVLQKIQQLISYHYGSNKNFQRGSGVYTQADKAQLSQVTNSISQGMLGKPAPEPANVQPQQGPQYQQQASLSTGLLTHASRIALPLPQGITRYFIVKSCNRENLELSAQQGVWATQRSNEAKLNEAFDSVENVILIFSINRTRNFQGCAKMSSKIGAHVGGGNWKYAHGTPHYGRNFSVKWLKLCELSFEKTQHLRNPYNENLPVKISRDCQELEPSIGEQLASLLYVEPDSELMEVSIAAEAKREEETAKGVTLDGGVGNPDIVPFEDNEDEEEEEEESEDEESFSQGFGFGVPFHARGRGRAPAWPPHVPIPRGPRQLGGYSPMMGADGFSYGPMAPDGFGMSDLFGMAPRGFHGFGPRFPGDFVGPNPGMMFPGRPSHHGPAFPSGGFGLMMGHGPVLGRGPFVGGMGVGPHGPTPPPFRGSRPAGLPFGPPSQNGGRFARRDIKAPPDRPDQYGPSDQPRGGAAGIASNDGDSKASGEQFGLGNNFRSTESDSEDEAPRRSRHGEGKKR